MRTFLFPCVENKLASFSPLPHMTRVLYAYADVQATHRALAEHAKRDPYGAFHVPPHCPQFGTAAAASAANGCCSSTAFRAGEMVSVFLFCFFLPNAEILDGVGGADMVHEGLPASVDSLRRTSLEIRSVVRTVRWEFVPACTCLCVCGAPHPCCTRGDYCPQEEKEEKHRI